MAQLSSVPEFDDNANKVAFKIDVREGLQYRMGKLITRGFSESATKMLHERWGLKTGMVFDQEYSKEFSEKQIGEILKDTWLERRTQGKPAPNIKWGDNVNRETLTVDVMVELTNQEGPGPPEGPRL